MINLTYDDDSDTVHAKNEEILRNLIEKEATNSAEWLKDNRLCVAGDKSKLLVLGTKQLRASKLTQEAKIVVDEKEIVETPSEKLLGVVINNELTWKNHLYGDSENEGLTTQLSRRIGMLSKMSKYMNKDNLKYFANGIFYSKLNYCLPVFGNVLGLDEYKENNSRYQSFTFKDNSNLQVLQNKLNRMLLKAPKTTSTQKLLEDTASLSIQQMIGYHTAILAYKIVKSGKPTYLATKLIQQKEGMELRGRLGRIHPAKKKLFISKEGFLYRGACILNKLDDNLRNESKLDNFKSGMKKWVKRNISIKPVSKHPQLVHRNNGPIHMQPQADPNLYDIRRFLIPQTPVQGPAQPPVPPPQPTDRPPPLTVQRGIQRYFAPRH